MRLLPRSDPLKRSLKAAIRVAMNPSLPMSKRHGSVWFQVDGFGELKRDFLVDDLELLQKQPKKLAPIIARQIMLIDQSLPKREAICAPTRIDIVGHNRRLVYDLPTFHLVLDQPL
jgi:hypothetical protein